MSDLTTEEQRHVRAAMRFLRRRCGGVANLSSLLRLSLTTIRHVVDKGRALSPMIAFRVARLAEVPIDDLLAGKYPPEGTCQHCGQMKEPAAMADFDAEMPGDNSARRSAQAAITRGVPARSRG